jgi:hypothetical protein
MRVAGCTSGTHRCGAPLLDEAELDEGVATLSITPGIRRQVAQIGSQGECRRPGALSGRVPPMPPHHGWPHDLSDEEILERLLAFNLQWTRAV